MVSTTQRNHYETLGITPGATAAEIERAYAMELMRPRAFGGLAQIGIAYATLRDAAKRKAYYEAIGVAPKPPMVLAPAFGNWMTAAAHIHPAVQTRVAPVPPAAPPPERESFVAASLRQIADPEPLIKRSDAPAQVPPAIPDAQLVEEHEDVSTIDWRRPAMIGGGLVLAATLIGAWAGSSAQSGEEVLPTEAAVTMPVPAATATTRLAEVKPAEVARAAPVARAIPSRRTKPAMPRPIPLTPAEEQELAGGTFVDSATGQATAAAASIAEESAPAVAAATMPLSGRTVARTIGRIGYACGSVSSVTAAAAPGVFKVTCASGDAYQARPVRGRYHFRRWGRP